MARSLSRERVADRSREASGVRKRSRSRSPARENGRVNDSKRPRRSPSVSRDRGATGSGRDRHRDERDRDRHRRSEQHSDRQKDREKDRDRDGDKQRERDKDHYERRASRGDEREGHKERHRDRERGSEVDRGDEPLLPGPPAQPVEQNGTAANGAKASAAVAKAQPPSLEEFMRKREEEQAADAKPKFLSKKQREELALQNRQAAVDAQRKREHDMRQVHGVFSSSSADRERDARQKEADKKAEAERLRRNEDREKEKNLELIKKQYLGGDKVKKKMLKPSEKFKFNFDWEATDDTSRDLNPLYNSTHEATLLFGSGTRAGMDRREQKKLSAEHKAQLLRKMRESQGVKETREDRARDRERASLADVYETFDMRKDSHWTDKRREDMTERDWRIFREDFSIAYKGAALGTTALPLRNWDECSLPQPLMKAVERQGYKQPSPIQRAAIPIGLQQRDVIGVAETGSGKTAAFVLPMLVYIMNQPVMTEEVATDGPYAVIMAPTRELAQQIEEEAGKLAHYTEYRMVSVVGGQNIEEQGFKLRKGCEIIIATPGRLLDCLEKSYAVLNQCNYVVLDEADRMIDLGFEPQVMAVLDAMPSSNLKPESDDATLDTSRVYRTTYMFSATMPAAVERLARKYLRRPVVINIGSAGKATDLVQQRVYVLKDNEKPHRLEQELNAVDEKRAIVFVNTKNKCDFVSRHLDTLGYRCTVLHGSKTQDQREAGLAGFREEKYNVLVATDVAGRGIDVPDVALVVNYDMPGSIENYTHRIGRTGRAGRKGIAVTFLTLSDTDVFFDLKKLLEESGASVPPQLAHHEAARIKPGGVDARPRRDQVVYAKH
ncbi:hypothetical protein WJX73_005873 [Symbiochloris irregularis]|uniref:DEAD-box ATP-dependent RNA helicase 21 n=1 Tax=Symbiochloris irregularis TaxID=706552 RepID=A0AAW1P146_9CHLO